MPILIATIKDKPQRRFIVTADLVDAYSGIDLHDHFKLWVRNKLRSGGISPALEDIKIEGLVDVSAVSDGVLEALTKNAANEFNLLSIGCRVASMVLGKPRSQLTDEEVDAGVQHARWLMGQDVEPPFTLKIRKAVIEEPYEPPITGH